MKDAKGERGVRIMIIIDCEQRGEQWFLERLGKPSSSRFGEIFTPTGLPSKQAKKYMMELAGERLIGVKPESYQNMNMIRGSEMEGEARQFYEMINNVKVQQIGCCFQDDRKLWVSSPDGVVGDDGLLEIKSPTLSVAVEYLLNQKIPTIYIPQLQGQILTTGRKWVDFLSYYPGLPPLIIRVPRDDKFCAALKVELESFCEELDRVTDKLRELS